MPLAVILTALPVEYLAVRSYLTELQEEEHPQGMIYQRGRFAGSDQAWEVGIAEVGAGNASSAVEAERAICYFKPDVIFFVGIAGGIKDVRIGDVVAATKVYGYESGKSGEKGFAVRPTSGQSTYAVVQRAKSEARKGEWLQRLNQDSHAQPRALVAPIAAGEKVIASTDTALFQFLRESYNDAIAVEMEGYGFLNAAFAYPNIKTMVIRGISDLIKNKNEDDPVEGSEEERQKRASQNASAFAFELLASMPTKPSRSGTTRFPNSEYLKPSLCEPPPSPSIFLGREDDIIALKNILKSKISSQEPHSLQVLTAVRGWPGIGKTTLATVLANDLEVRQAFPDGILWTSFGKSPDIFSELLAWACALDSKQLLSVTTLKEAISIMSGILRSKKLLLVVDDVWKAEHIIPIQKACGASCVLLVTTRLPGVVNDLSLPNSCIYNLPPLTEEKALELLNLLAPTVVSEYRKECQELIQDIECLPLAVHVAGRLLNAEVKLGWGVTHLLQELRAGASLIRAKAPADRIDLEEQTIPTVATLLKRSTDYLDENTRNCFAFLGPFSPKPATFDFQALQAVWQIDDPRPVVRILVDRGLLEPVGSSFQMHALLVQHARYLLSEACVNG
jgi:nucleoside phosphorylase